MKLTFRTILVTVALAISALGSTATAEASPSLSIGPGPAYTPVSSSGSITIVDHCINKGYYWFGAYRVYGAYCATHYSWWSVRTYVYYDQWNRQWLLDCWSTPLESYPCQWR
jgi:hypothetical protein